MDDFLPVINRSMNWDCIGRWIIVYDMHNLKVQTPHFKHNPQVLEVFADSTAGASGNQFRNIALQLVTHGMIYFCDADNAMHPQFWKWYAANASLGHVYTFDQLRAAGANPHLLLGRRPVKNCIDTAQLLVDRALVGNLSWTADDYGADGDFISTLVQQHPQAYQYVPEVMAYHNFGRAYVGGAAWTRLPWPNATTAKRVWPC